MHYCFLLLVSICFFFFRFWFESPLISALLFFPCIRSSLANRIRLPQFFLAAEVVESDDSTGTGTDIVACMSVVVSVHFV